MKSVAPSERVTRVRGRARLTAASAERERRRRLAEHRGLLAITRELARLAPSRDALK